MFRPDQSTISGKVLHGTKVRDQAIVERQPCVVEDGEFGHLRASHITWHIVKCTHKAFDVLHKRPHDVQGIPS